MKKFYLLLLALVATISASAASSQLFVIGELGEGWIPNKGVALEKTSEGVFEGDFTVAGEKYFAFADLLSDNDSDWDTLNKHRYNPSGGQDVVEGDSGNAMRYGGQDGSWKINSGKWHFKVDTNQDSMKFYATKGGEVEVVYTYGIHGTIFGDDQWQTYDMTETEGKWVIEGAVVPGDFGIKPMVEGAQSGWISSAAGAALGEAQVGTPIAVTKTGGTNWSSTLEGNYTFTFDPEAMTLMVTKSGEEPGPGPDPVTEKPVLRLYGPEYPDTDARYEFVLDEATGVYSLELKYGLFGNFRIVGEDSNGKTYSFSNGKSGETNGVRLGHEYELTASATPMSLRYNTTSHISMHFTPDETFAKGTLSFEVNRHEWDYAGITIFFEDTEGWGSVNCYAWNTHDADNPDADMVNNAAWPGVAMTKVEGTENLWMYNSPDTRYQNVIFNSGSNQTSDLNARLGGIYNAGLNRRSDLDEILETFVPEAPASTVVTVAAGTGVKLDGNTIGGVLTDLGEEFEVLVEVAEGADHAAYYKVTPAPENGIEMLAINGFEPVKDGKVMVPVGSGTLDVATAVHGVLSAPTSYSYSVSKNTTGVENVSVEAGETEVEYFNLQGVRVAQPEKGGIYIVRRGNTIAKIRF